MIHFALVHILPVILAFLGGAVFQATKGPKYETNAEGALVKVFHNGKSYVVNHLPKL
jgi:hypothetical protein